LSNELKTFTAKISHLRGFTSEKFRCRSSDVFCEAFCSFSGSWKRCRFQI